MEFNFTELECDECGKDDSDSILCITCDELLCRDCVNSHDKKHELSDPQNAE